jgi:threonine dehydratase
MIARPEENVPITYEKIKSAAGLLKRWIIQTPIVYSQSLSQRFHAKLFLKLENLQRTGSFKIRGATHKLLTHRHSITAAGVVAASAGNHAQGVALAAQQAGVPATIVMPNWSSISKQEATRHYGGKVIIEGQSIAESLDHAYQIAQKGALFMHPYDDFDIILGQSTMALEILDTIAKVDTLIVPVGGGGLIAGVCATVQALGAKTRIIGVQSSSCASLPAALQSHKPVKVDAGASIADGISVRQIGHLNYAMIASRLDEIVAVDDEAIAEAILLLLERKKVLAEGAGAVPLAALMSGKVSLKEGERVVLVISGGNVDSPLLDRILRKGLTKRGRIMRCRVRLSDVPGSLAQLLAHVAKLEANVLHIFHDRKVRDLPINDTSVELELETRGEEHIQKISKTLAAAGYQLF